MAISSDSTNRMQAALTCDTCENTAKHLCNTCHDRLCDNCKSIHSKSNSSKDHQVVLLTYEALNSTFECPSYHVCKWHPIFRSNVGCQTCDVLVCEKCISGEHKGHSFIGIYDFFQYKKSKLEENLTTVRSQLQKYEDKVEEIKKKQKEVQKNRDEVKDEIVGQVEKVTTNLKSYEEKLLNDADEKAAVSFQFLSNNEKSFNTVIQNLQEYINSVQSNNSPEKLAFIFYTTCAVDVTVPEVCSSDLNPATLEYRVETRDLNKHGQTLLGHVIKRTDITLRRNEMIEIIRAVKLGKRAILSLAYSSQSEAFWISSEDSDAYEKYDEQGHLKSKIETNISGKLNKPFCLIEVDNIEQVVYRYDASTIFMYKNSPNQLMNVTTLFPISLCATNDGEILAALACRSEEFFVILRFSLSGECRQYITNIIENWSEERVRILSDSKVYVVENINKDICLSVNSSKTKAVILICSNGDHKLTYKGAGSSILKPFVPRGLCTNVLGQILIADEKNRLIHVLNKEGGFLTIFGIPDEPRCIPISICTDNKNNLCIGCNDGEIRILKYLD